MSKNSIIFILITLIIIGSLFYLNRRDRLEIINQINTMKQSRQAAEEWIKNNSPTYTFDGSDLTLVAEEELITKQRYSFTFSFISSSAGYGDRSDQMVAQVITPHTIEIVVDDSQVVSAITDEVYDEIQEKKIEESAAEDELAPETLSVQVYFVRVVDGQEEIVPVEREIAYTNTASETAIEELLKGPLPEEEEQGYSTAINENTHLQSIEVSNKVARINFSQRLDEDVAGSARVTAIRNQIEKTLLQFDAIDEVIIAVDGETEGILQP